MATALIVGETNSFTHATKVFAAEEDSGSKGETIVLIRHAEKPSNGLGQLTCKGLNRSLALPKVLQERYGRPTVIFAPDPAQVIHEGNQNYSYVRPLATIEPAAVEAGLPVSTQRSYKDIAGLRSDVLANGFKGSTVFIAWEHYYAYEFARALLIEFGKDPSDVPAWPNSDYDMIFVFHILPAAKGGGRTLTFDVEHEGLNGDLLNTCPGQ